MENQKLTPGQKKAELEKIAASVQLVRKMKLYYEVQISDHDKILEEALHKVETVQEELNQVCLDFEKAPVKIQEYEARLIRLDGERRKITCDASKFERLRKLKMQIKALEAEGIEIPS